MKYLLVAFGILFLTSCAELVAWKQTGIAAKEQYSDEEADVLKRAPCAMTVGAKNRNLSSKEKCAVEMLCYGECTLLPDPVIRPQTLQ